MGGKIIKRELIYDFFPKPNRKIAIDQLKYEGFKDVKNPQKMEIPKKWHAARISTFYKDGGEFGSGDITVEHYELYKNNKLMGYFRNNGYSNIEWL